MSPAIIPLHQELAPEDVELVNARSVVTHLAETAKQLDIVIADLQTFLDRAALRLADTDLKRIGHEVPPFTKAVEAYLSYQRNFFDDRDGNDPSAFLSYQDMRLALVDVTARQRAGAQNLATFATELKRVDAKMGVVEELAKHDIFRRQLEREAEMLERLIPELPGNLSFQVSQRIRITRELIENHVHFQQTRICDEIVFMDQIQAGEFADVAELVASEHDQVFRQYLRQLAFESGTIPTVPEAPTLGLHGIGIDDDPLTTLQTHLEQLTALQAEVNQALATALVERSKQNALAESRPGPELPPLSPPFGELLVMVPNPHPDDFANSAGLEAELIALGHKVIEVLMTAGEGGRVLVPHQDKPRTARRHGSIRLGHVHDARRALHDGDPHARAYWLNRGGDSGMPNDSGQYAEGTFAWSMVNRLDDVVDAQVRLMRYERPDVLLNWPPAKLQGAYAHPDHIATHLVVEEAYRRAQDPNYKPELGEAHRPLLYAYKVWSPEQLVAIDRAGRGGQEVGGNKHDLTVPFSHQSHVRASRALLAHKTQVPRSAALFEEDRDGDVVTRMPPVNYLKVVESAVPLRLDASGTTTLQDLLPELETFAASQRQQSSSPAHVAELALPALV